jgi:hypothetical protein
MIRIYYSHLRHSESLLQHAQDARWSECGVWSVELECGDKACPSDTMHDARNA